MSERIPQNFLTQPPKAIATYDYIDIAEATGVAKFYGADCILDAAQLYFLSTNDMYSQNIYTGIAYSHGATFTKVLDKDFDVLFNLPQNIKGKARANITVGGNKSAGDGDVEIYAILKIRKYSGTTETEIADCQSNTIALTTGVVSFPLNLEIDIASVQHFKKGDTLRLTVEIWGKNTGTATCVICGFAHDPKNRAAAALIETGEPTELTVFMPFLLDL